jgi:hypothetical protein
MYSFNNLFCLLCRLIEYLGESPNYGGLIRKSTSIPLAHNLEFMQDLPVKTVAQLKSDPELGTFIVNARMLDIVQLNPWWFPVCDCRVVFTKYIGAFHCVKCRAKDLTVAPK